MSFFRRSHPSTPVEAAPEEVAPEEVAQPFSDALSYDVPVALDPLLGDLPVAHDETVTAHDPLDEAHTTDPFAQTVEAAGVAESAAGVSEWAGDGSTRQKLGHISGGIAPFVTVLPTFVRGRRAPALLVLEDGRTFRGEVYGAAGETHGEAVFNTGMTGYEETLTDPSYYGQVVAMTAPHIGNTGYNDEDPESSRIWVAGFVVRDPARIASNWRAGRTLEEELQAQGIVGISGIDTRALTRHLRERGAMRVGISSAELDPQSLLDRVLASPGMSGADLAPKVSTKSAYVVPAQGERRYTVAALDLGIKAATPRYLAERGVEVHVLPSKSTSADLLAGNPDGVFISNGPGDPAAMDYAVDALRGVLDADVPMFGICFGNQILGRAFGLSTYKLRYGHRGINQPVKDRSTGRVHVTSHNHGFAVQADLDGPTDTPYGRVAVSHLGLNDNVVEGLSALDRPAFSVQYHPESAAGPHDAIGLFSRFTELMDSRK